MSESLLSLGGLSLERLRNFCLIADAGSLTKAARGDAGRMALFSRQIKELETFFGVELRRRKGKGIVITANGHRLAALAREQFAGLEDFRRSCRQLPVEVSIASGNSILEWLLLPKSAELRQELPGVHLRVLSQRTRDIVEGLMQQSLDFGLIRADALRPGLRSEKVRAEAYSLFVPRRLAPGLSSANLRRRIGELPIATSLGGQFREQLEADAEKAKWPLNIELSCSSFTQAARALASGAYAAVLPDVASAQFDRNKVARFELPFLKGYIRPLVLAWHPRTAAVRPILTSAHQSLIKLLR
jgi:LysR family transcriptional regulator, nitrogen assimilation regulatory protein